MVVGLPQAAVSTPPDLPVRQQGSLTVVVRALPQAAVPLIECPIFWMDLFLCVDL